MNQSQTSVVTTIVSIRSFLLGLSFKIKNDKNKVIQIHRNDNKIVTDNHSSLISTRLKNQDNHHRDQTALLNQNVHGNRLSVLNSHKYRLKHSNINAHVTAANMKYINSQYVTIIHHQVIVVTAVTTSETNNIDIFFGNLRVLKSIEAPITTNTAIIVIIKDIIDTSENKKKDKIIVSILFTFVKGIITDIFSSLSIFCITHVLRLHTNNTKNVTINTTISSFHKSTHL